MGSTQNNFLTITQSLEEKNIMQIDLSLLTGYISVWSFIELK